MMTHKEAMDKIADKININTESINYEDIVDLITDIYDSIGSCEECKYYELGFGYCDSPRQEYRSEEAGFYFVDPDWYCADFKPKE